MDKNNKLNDQTKDAKYNKLEKIKNNYFLQKTYDNINKKRALEIVKHNKTIQDRLNLSVKDYKEYSELYTPIELEIIPTDNPFCKFINVNEDDKLYYHIFFDDNNKEITNTYEIFPEDNIKKIKIIIDYQVKSFKELFYDCQHIESIIFKKFYRTNINNMSSMFFLCYSLKELNLSNFRTDNVSDMSFMFYGCSSLKELNLSNFSTYKVTNMSFMFNDCSSLIALNLSNFITDNVKRMTSMFEGCSSLKELNISNFNMNNVIDKECMFYRCSSLKN